MKIYTKTGDDSTSSLFGGSRVDKHHLRLVCYGTLDELNAFIAVLIDSGLPDAYQGPLRRIQHQIFSTSALLATEPDKLHMLKSEFDLIGETKFLEEEMDRMDRGLHELTNFVLPGGHILVSHCHVCRTVCRRAERSISLLNASEKLDPGLLSWINRLSDYFFVLGRRLTQELNAPEILWNSSSSSNR